MEQRDILLEQFEQMGRVLGEMLANFLRLRRQGQVAEGLAMSRERMQSELQVDMDELLMTEEAAMDAYLQARNLTAEHTELLAELLMEIGEAHHVSDTEISQQYLEKSLLLLRIADQQSEMLSFDRLQMKAQIEKLLPPSSAK